MADRFFGELRVRRWCAMALACLVGGAVFGERQVVRLAAVPSVSPDGSWFTFTWRGDVWRAPIEGGTVTQLTRHPGVDTWPCISPDGAEIAFTSNRDGSYQLFRMPAAGGVPEKFGFHAEGYSLLEWTPDGKGIVAGAWRDHGPISAKRLVEVPVTRGAERLLFDAYGQDAAVSPDGRRILFSREGSDLYRKGYRGAKASQIWLYDRETASFDLLAADPGGCRSPMWRADGKGFYFLRQDDKRTFNVFSQDLKPGAAARQLTFHEDEGAVYPKISRDGKTMIYRVLFDFYRFRPESGEPPSKIDLVYDGDASRTETRRRFYKKVWNNDSDGRVDWLADSMQAIFTAGGDLWVMDTDVRNPHRMCEGATAIHEREAIFSPGGDYVLALRDFGDRVEIWRLDRGDDSLPWWKNRAFKRQAMVETPSEKRSLSFSPDGKRLSWSEPGRLVIADLDGGNQQTIYRSVGHVEYDWAPDSRQMVIQAVDEEDNRDIWIVDTTGERPAYNLSRHPEWDGSPRWSQDGRYVAWLGERGEPRKIDLYFVALHSKDEPVDEAASKLQDKLEPPQPKEEPEGSAKSSTDDANSAATDEPLVIDVEFETLAERVHRVSADADFKCGIVWGPGNKLAYYSKAGKDGTKTIVVPNKLKPNDWMSTRGEYPQWTKSGKLLWVVNGVPAFGAQTYDFSVYQETNVGAYNRLALRLAWRYFRDNFSDPTFNHKDWDAILAKYDAVAEEVIDESSFDRLLNMLFGEVNASHTWFRREDREWKGWSSGHKWSEKTHHLGVRLAVSETEPGARVAAVLPGGPADKAPSRLVVGDVIVRVNGTELTPGLDPTIYLNGPANEMFELQVRGADGALRTVAVESISWERARELAADGWARDNRKMVDALGDKRLAYLHVDRMNWENLEKFTEQIYSRGFDRDGFVIDVRNNLGGFVADRLLNVLCRPIHAVTVARSGNQGERAYPRGYLIYWTWDKPIVVLCNQNTVSNGEIFSHAIRTLKRGKLVGVPTEGGVISTPKFQLLDLGEMGMPNRAWFTIGDGQDMEMNGAMPDHVVWPEPGDVPAGRDVQLETAVKILLDDVADYKKQKQQPLIWAAERQSLGKEPPVPSPK